MKDVKNQYLRTGATIVVLSFLGTLGLSLLAPQSTQNDEEHQLVSYQKAKSIGQTIVERMNEEGLKTRQRRPASADNSGTESQGYMGTDDEGQPYHYSVLQTDVGVARVIVRSGGPKGRIEYVEEGGREMPLPNSPSPKASTSKSY
jgi:hypothetical protein